MGVEAVWVSVLSVFVIEWRYRTTHARTSQGDDEVTNATGQECGPQLAWPSSLNLTEEPC